MIAAPDLMHGQDYAGQDVAGWIATEKLDGCRARWDGAQLWSRGGHSVKAPPEMLSELPPDIALDGELYAGPGTRCAVAAAMRTGRWPPNARLIVFDAPNEPGDFQQRLRAAERRMIGQTSIGIVTARKISGIAEARAMLRTIKHAGGEGIMLHQPDQGYLNCRSPCLLKLKYEGQQP